MLLESSAAKNNRGNEQFVRDLPETGSHRPAVWCTSRLLCPAIVLQKVSHNFVDHVVVLQAARDLWKGGENGVALALRSGHVLLPRHRNRGSQHPAAAQALEVAVEAASIELR